MTATDETLVETLWACRQFIVDVVHNGDELAIILRLDKELAPPSEQTPNQPDQYNPYCNGWVQSL